MPKNNYCDNDKCTETHGEVRLYPLGGGANLILCHACWAHENRYRYERDRSGTNWPQQNWYAAQVYSPEGESHD